LTPEVRVSVSAQDIDCYSCAPGYDDLAELGPVFTDYWFEQRKDCIPFGAKYIVVNHDFYKATASDSYTLKRKGAGVYLEPTSDKVPQPNGNNKYSLNVSLTTASRYGRAKRPV
jgi:hypothetical protein